MKWLPIKDDEWVPIIQKQLQAWINHGNLHGTLDAKTETKGESKSSGSGSSSAEFNPHRLHLSLPSALLANDLERLKNDSKHVVIAEKWNGDRNVLFLTAKGFAIRSDRRFQMSIAVHDETAPAELAGQPVVLYELVKQEHLPLVFDCEHDPKDGVFRAFDCMVGLGGDVISNRPFFEREYQALNAICMVQMLQDVLQIEWKPFVRGKDVTQEWINGVEKRLLNGTCDGVIVQDDREPYFPDKARQQKKWKLFATIDVCTDGYKLWYYNRDRSENVLQDTVYCLSANIGAQLQQALKQARGRKRPRVIVECKFDAEQRVWVVSQLRLDKMSPNDCSVIEETIWAVKENVKLEQVVMAAGAGDSSSADISVRAKGM